MGECPDKVEAKFLIEGEKYSVYISTDEERKILEDYLDYDFIAHEERKLPGGKIHDKELVIACQWIRSLTVAYPNDRMLGFFKDFEGDKNNALPLHVFIDNNPLENYPEYLI